MLKQGEFLSKDFTNSLKGIGILLIMLHHLITLYLCNFDYACIKFIIGVFAPLVCSFFYLCRVMVFIYLLIRKISIANY